MARYEIALRSPHVDIIAHPSGRKIGRRPDLDLDWDAFYRLAAETARCSRSTAPRSGSTSTTSASALPAMPAAASSIDSDAHDPTEWQHLVWGDDDRAPRLGRGPSSSPTPAPLDAFLAFIRGARPRRAPEGAPSAGTIVGSTGHDALAGRLAPARFTRERRMSCERAGPPAHHPRNP